MTRRQLIAEITSDLQQYEESNLINHISLKQKIKTAIKRFGNNIMTPTDIVLKIVSGKAQLPTNFWKLDLAVRCYPLGYTIETSDIKSVITSTVFKTRIEQDYEWNNQIDTYVNKNYKQITEKVYIDNNVVNYHYGKPAILKITRGMRKENCLSTCKNLQDSLTYSSPWEVNIINETLQTNFEDGYVYIQYAGLPTDEEGELIVPTTQHDHLQNYIIYHCKAWLIETLMGNGDDENLINMFKIYSSKESEYFSLAMTETKMEGLGHDWDKKMKNRMRRDTLKYENLFPRR